MNIFIILFTLCFSCISIFIDIYIIDKLDKIYELLCDIIKGSFDI